MTTHAAPLRSRVYGMLALAFHGAPPAETVACTATVLADARELADGPTIGALEELGSSRVSESEEALRQDFQDLFLVPTLRYVRPHESVHADEPVAVGDREPMATNHGPSTAAVSRFYARVGLSVAPDYSELPDFVGLELACMEFLCAREAEHREAGDDSRAANAASAQVEFLEEHLLRWVPRLAQLIRERATTTFHARLADATARWLSSDARRVCGAR